MFDPDPTAIDYVAVYVTGGSGHLDAWIDWNGNYRWDPSEKVIAGKRVYPGWNYIMVTTPSDATDGFRYARFRLSSGGTMEPFGPAPDGEVEDHRIEVRYGSGSDRIPNRLRVEQSTGSIILIWDAVGGVLEQADTPNGLWVPIVGATSPHLVVPNTPQKFFRIVGGN